MNVTKNIEVVTRTIQEDKHVGFVLTLSMEEAAVLSGLAGKAQATDAYSYAINTGRLKTEQSTAWVADLLVKLAKIVPSQ